MNSENFKQYLDFIGVDEQIMRGIVEYWYTTYGKEWIEDESGRDLAEHVSDLMIEDDEVVVVTDWGRVVLTSDEAEKLGYIDFQYLPGKEGWDFIMSRVNVWSVPTDKQDLN